jgi:hypothetical protein
MPAGIVRKNDAIWSSWAVTIRGELAVDESQEL